jgi:hypothetical protein
VLLLVAVSGTSVWAVPRLSMPLTFPQRWAITTTPA